MSIIIRTANWGYDSVAANAFNADRLIGSSIMLMNKCAGIGHIRNTWVLPEYQRQGIAGRLHDTLILVAKSNEIDVILARTINDLEAPARNATRRGYTQMFQTDRHTYWFKLINKEQK